MESEYKVVMDGWNDGTRMDTIMSMDFKPGSTRLYCTPHKVSHNQNAFF